MMLKFVIGLSHSLTWNEAIHHDTLYFFNGVNSLTALLFEEFRPTKIIVTTGALMPIFH